MGDDQGAGPDTLLARAAGNLADWHEVSLAALGRPGRYSTLLWTASPPPGTPYLSMVVLAPNDRDSAHIEEISAFVASSGSTGEVLSDAWGTLELGRLGFETAEARPWFARPAGSMDARDCEGVEIEKVTTASSLADYEATAALAFVGHTPATSHSIHHPAILDDGRMHVFVARVGGRPVAGAMACVSRGVVGLYGVGTLPGHRRRGYGEAVTCAALRLAPDLPSVLQPSVEAERLYRGLGFDAVGTYRNWRLSRD